MKDFLAWVWFVGCPAVGAASGHRVLGVLVLVSPALPFLAYELVMGYLDLRADRRAAAKRLVLRDDPADFEAAMRERFAVPAPVRDAQ